MWLNVVGHCYKELINSIDGQKGSMVWVCRQVSDTDANEDDKLTLIFIAAVYSIPGPYPAFESVRIR